jgi:hypothetical protein
MAAVTRSQRVFNAVFPPNESPFLSGLERTEPLRADQQKFWDVVTRVLKPNFSQVLNNQTSLITGGLLSKL